MKKETREVRLKRVEEVFCTGRHTIYEIEVEGKEVIRSTTYHPFCVAEREWTNVIQLCIGDQLVTPDGRAEITQIEKQLQEDMVKAYNFHVEEWSSYFVSEQDVYVHNGLGDHGNLEELVDNLDDIVPPQLAGAGEDLYVGTYSKSSYWNKKNGINGTHTPHHVIQDKVSSVSHGKGITINIKKDIHLMTDTYGSSRNFTSKRQHLAADIAELKVLLKSAGYDRGTINRQLKKTLCAFL